MAYSTETKVRRESGFVNNANITTAEIADLMDEAYSIIRSSIGSRYALSELSTNFDGSDAQKLLSRIETTLAGAFLLMRTYQAESDQYASGESKMNHANGLLDEIMKGKLKLFDSNGDEFTALGSESSGTPESVTEELEDDDLDQLDKVF